MKKIADAVYEVLETNKASRNDNFVLVLEVYKKLQIPVETNFLGLMIEHNKYALPSFESIVRARRKIVEQHPELDADKKVRTYRKIQEENYREFAIGG